MDIIKLAKEAGFEDFAIGVRQEQLERFAALVLKAEADETRARFAQPERPEALSNHIPDATKMVSEPVPEGFRLHSERMAELEVDPDKREAIEAARKRLRGEPVKQEPVARVTGYYGGRCVIEPLNRTNVFPTNMALYAAPVDAKAILEELEVTKRCLFQMQEVAKAIRAEAYQQGRDDMKEEAAKVCDDYAEKCVEAENWEAEDVSLINAAAIRNLSLQAKPLGD